MTLMPLPHGNTGTIPKPILGLLLLILIIPTGTQRFAELDLMLGEALDDDGGDGEVGAVRCGGVFDVGVGKGCHGLGGFLHRFGFFGFGHFVELFLGGSRVELCG